MDREKKQAKRGANKIKPLHVADFIALGTKSSRTQSETTDQKIKTKSTLISTSSTERKSEASISSSAIPAKKAKLSTTSSTSQIKRVGSVGKKDVVKADEWDAIAIEIDSADLVNKVLEAEDSSDDEKVEALLCGAVKKLKSGRLKFDALLFLSLQYLVKTRPFLFCSELIIEAFCSLLKRDMNVNFKGKANNLVSILAANVLMAAYKDESSWPEVFVKAYVEDSLGERVWVDHDYCKGFIDNILTAFNTKSIPKNLMIPERLLKPEACPSPPNIGTDDDESCSSVSIEVPENIDSVAVYPRYVYSEDSLTQHVLEVIKEQLTRRQPAEISRNTLRFLVSTSGISEVRLTVCQKLEIWLQNPKLTKPAQELLLAVCLNCNLHNQHDVEVISQLIKIRIKAKPVVNHYLLCMKELIGQHTENLSTLLKHSIYNELSSSRNPNNMQLLSIIFLHSPDRAAKVLAEVFLDLLCNRDDYLRALRALLREIVRTVRYDLNFSLFCIGLLQEKRDTAFLDLEPAMKERVFLSITDLVVLAIFLGVSPTVKEQFSICTRGEKKDLSNLRSYQVTVANIQRDAVWWLYSVVPKIFGKTGRNEFVHCIHKLLFMEQIEHYYNKDNWPTESERMPLLRLASEIPLLEDTLMRVLIIGLSRDHPLSAADALELADQLVKRAAVTYFDDFPVLEFENTELCDIIFNLCAYHHPENITLPQGYHPPNLAISELYWKAWTMLLVIVCHNPSTFGDMAWKTYPMLRNLMEMCITNQFVFPPPTLALGEKADEIKNREMQMTQMEKDQILLFESHLAAASTKVTITESNSLLLSKLISMDPHGTARKPPSAILEQLKKMNQNCRLGDLLCHSRNPDFLLDVIQRQGTTQSMSWLSELVESSASSFNMLPVQCLCEFLISEGSISSDANDISLEVNVLKKKKKQQQLLFHLQKILREPGSEPHDTIEVISYFMKRLSSQQTGARAMAIKGLTMILSQPMKSPTSDDEDIIQKSEGEYNWLLTNIPQLPHFEVIRSQISIFLRQASQIENDPITIASYVTFLADRTPEQNLQEYADLALDMAQMIVERPTIVNTILPNEGCCNEYSNNFLSSVSQIFFKYLSAAKMPSKEVYSWSESQDQILIQWYTGESATMHILVVHAMIIVLTYGPPPSSGRSYFDALLEIWFPSNADPPKAFLVDTSEEALLLPDWLKLRMIRSSVGILVDAALKDLDPSQLVLFIQSFGIPVSSMSKLLKTLDLAVEYDSFFVEQAVLDKSYMSQLVEVQHRRGASGGEKFAKLLVDSDSTEMNMDCDAVPNQTPVIQRAPPKLPTAISVESLAVSLIKLLGLKTAFVLNAKQEQDIFKGLQKALSKDILSKRSESGAIGVFILTCEQILRSESKMPFLQALHRKTYYSSVLFRLATASQSKVDINKSPLAQKLKWTCQQIIYALSGTNSSLVTVASQFYNKHKIQETKKPAPWKLFIQQFDQDKLDSESITRIVQAAETDDSLRLEEVMQYLVKNAISKGDTKPLMNAMTNITLKRLTDKVSTNIKTFNRSKFCFFVDWLECLEPKIISSFPKSQCHLLFSLVGAQQEPISVPFRPYLLALLIHQSSWEILHYYIDTVLNLTNTDLKFDPSSVLDFLYACIYIPKIWQGRYKKKNKRGNEEDILALTESQTKAVINYILEEASMKYPVVKEDKTDRTIAICGEYHTLEQRLKLLLMCLALRRSLINTSVHYVLQIISEGGLKGKLAQELLVQAYHQIPSILTLVTDAVSLTEESNVKNIHCKLDIISHTLLISLARTDATKNCSAKMAKIEFICKKLASTHPVLLLRQLPMMTSLLRGRCHLEYHLFRLQNHVALFSCFLSILELLPPHIFKSEYCSDLNCILCLYMDVFQTYGSPKEISHLLNRFFGFLLQYLAAKPSQARQFIHQYTDILQDLASTQQDLLGIRSILTGICMHFWGLSNSGADEKMESSIHDVITGLQFNSNASQASIASIMHRFSQETSEDTAAALQELESISYRKPAVLEQVVDHLKALMQDTNPQFRMTSFNLVMRYVKNNPSRGKRFISTYLQCLESDQVDIVLTALEHLPEFVVLVQEYATILLQKTFSVGIMKNINTAAQIRGTISYLVAQSGC